jgi:threonyl-tRNA synthetase
MKILLLHTDSVKWEPKKKAIKQAEEAKKGPVKVKEALVVLSAVESPDEQDPAGVSKRAATEVEKVASQVKARKVVLYPYAHLSSDLSSPDTALAVLKETERLLKAKKFSVKRAPFGWYKSFDIKCKGHPLSELSRDIGPDGKTKPRKSGQPDIIFKEQKGDVNYRQILRDISKSRLDREKLKPNDHRILGQTMDLFSFSEVAPGMVFWHPKGLIIWEELVKLWRQIHKEAGYLEISTPQVMDNKLWRISGHWDHYKDNMFVTAFEKRPFAVKPMNCPGAMIVYKSNPKSYKDLPLRIAELGVVHRRELSGVLAGLFRVVQFTQDDAHIFCTTRQFEAEIKKIIELTQKVYRIFGFKYNVELSTRPDKFMGERKNWDRAEASLEKILKSMKIKYKLNKGDGAFYGPKIDFHIKDSLGRSWQTATIQLDFQMAEQFELTYKGEDNKDHTPVMIHRVVYGAIERFIGVLLEHLSGNLPIWLSPVQVRLLSFTDRNIETVKKRAAELAKADLRVDTDITSGTVEHKVREAEVQRIPFIIVIGDKEEMNGTLAVRTRGEKKVKFGVKPGDFIKLAKSDIEKCK